MESNEEILAKVLNVSLNSIKIHKSKFLRIDEALKAMDKLVELIKKEENKNTDYYCSINYNCKDNSKFPNCDSCVYLFKRNE